MLNYNAKCEVIPMKNKNIFTFLIDGYLDEPSCLGVPPYLSPHIRYTFGALLDSGIKEKNLTYKTIDQVRENWEQEMKAMENSDLVIIIAGTTVPGNYRGGEPISLKEIKEIGQTLYYPQKVIGGPITLIKTQIKGYDHLCQEIAALDLYQILNKVDINENSSKNLSTLITNWSLKGAQLTKKHPNYPHLVCEIETFRGCPRTQHCKFCSERLKNITYQRKPADIINEVKELAKKGNHHFRLGCQTDLISYQAQKKNDRLIPNPEAINNLYNGVNKADPDLKVLHLDNMNPDSIVKYQIKSEKILNTIVNYNTPGDTAAFGLESADPKVLEKNNIASDPKQTFKAVKVVNKIGKKREQNIPKLLPGINFLHGLIGETPQTLKYNYNFLKKIFNNGLLLRRINIRQVATLDQYPEVNISKKQFEKYKKKVNENINKPMLKKVFPGGTILKNVLTETHRGKLTYGRQLGSYPILVGIPGQLKLNKFVSVRVIDHGYRSLTALPWPFHISEASVEQLTAIPGIGRTRANDIFINQPDNLQELKKYLDPAFSLNKWKDWFIFE